MKKATVAKKPRKQSAQRVTARQAKLINVKYLGDEPKFENDEIGSNIELLRTYNWYSSSVDATQAKEWLIDYAKANTPKLVNTMKALDEKNLNRTMAWIARLIMRGVTIPDSATEKFNNFLKSLPRIVKTEDTKEEDKAPKDRIGEWLPVFEDALDKLEPSFKPYQYIVANNVPQVYVVRIADYYQRVLDEIGHALNKTDKDVVEAYKHMKKAEIAIYGKYILNIIDDCARYIGNVKKERAPRKKRAKSMDQILKHFRYQEKHEPLKIVSANPQNIIGAKQLFVLNTTYNVLTLYVGGANGLGVHRSSITNFDEKLSKSKRVGRKTEAAIESVLRGSKSQRDKVFDLVNTDFIKVADRINNNTVLLRVIT